MIEAATVASVLLLWAPLYVAGRVVSWWLERNVEPEKNEATTCTVIECKNWNERKLRRKSPK